MELGFQTIFLFRTVLKERGQVVLSNYMNTFKSYAETLREVKVYHLWLLGSVTRWLDYLLKICNR